jgi:fatty-acyl-CoA synthase
MIIGDLVGRRAALSPDKTALIDTRNQNRLVSYAAWAARINRTANWLRSEMGVSKGDRVAVLAMNSGDYLDLWLACGRLGAILQNLNWRLSPAELRDLLMDAEPVLLVYDDVFPEAVAHMRDLSFVRHWIALETAQRAHDSFFRDRDNFPADPPPDLPLPDWDDPWVICYTGGTTGLPKGALLTHRAMLFNAINTVHSWELTADDCAILNAPLFHTGGLNVFTLPLILAGGCSILCRSFDVDQVFDLVSGGARPCFSAYQPCSA